MTDHLEYLRGRTVLVTGAAGTIGSALAERIAPHVRSVRCLDHNETELFFLAERLRSTDAAISPQLGDIRDLDRLRFAMRGVDVVFHTAALKHVGLGEYNPFEVVQTNLNGLNNVIRAALDANVERVVFTSSDKAVNPTNVMGASKMMGERLVTAANEIRGDRRTRFATVRFGNVVGSRGSVVPIFARQLLLGQPVTITHADMTRYVMTIPEAAALVIEAGARMVAGEVFVTKMHAVNVVDLAHAMADVLVGGRIEARVIGPRPGEKLYEELITIDERPRTLEVERLLVVLPENQFYGAARRADHPDGRPVERAWCSAEESLMSRERIQRYLREHGVLTEYLLGRGDA